MTGYPPKCASNAARHTTSVHHTLPDMWPGDVHICKCGCVYQCMLDGTVMRTLCFKDADGKTVTVAA